MLGLKQPTIPEFGFRARVPLANGRFDRTEVDLRLGNLLIEAKLTESDFQKAAKEVVHAYRDFAEYSTVKNCLRPRASTGRINSYETCWQRMRRVGPFA